MSAVINSLLEEALLLKCGRVSSEFVDPITAHDHYLLVGISLQDRLVSLKLLRKSVEINSLLKEILTR